MSVKLAGNIVRDPVLAKIVECLVEAYKPLSVYLFGSKARGEAGPDSDYDLMVIVPDDAPPERRRSRLAYERLWETGAAADVLVWTREAFLSRIHLKASLPGTIPCCTGGDTFSSVWMRRVGKARSLLPGRSMISLN